MVPASISINKHLADIKVLDNTFDDDTSSSRPREASGNCYDQPPRSIPSSGSAVGLRQDRFFPQFYFAKHSTTSADRSGSSRGREVDFWHRSRSRLPTHALALARLRLAGTAGCDVTVVHATALSRSTPGTLVVSPAAVSHKLIFGMVTLGGGCNIMDSCHGRQKHLRGSDGQGRQHLYTKQGVSSVLKPHKIMSSQTAPRRYLDPLRNHAALSVEIDTCKPPTQKPQPPSHRPFIDMSYLTQRRRPAQENQI